MYQITEVILCYDVNYCPAGSLLMKKDKEASNLLDQIPKKKAVTILGKQPGSNIWVLGPNFFVDEATGQLLHIETFGCTCTQ